MTPSDQPPVPTLSRRGFLKGSLGLFAIDSALARIAQAQPEGAPGPVMAYVGTFTRGTHFAEPYNAAPGNGLGIHVFQLDPATGALAPRGVFASDSSPNCLAVNRAQTHLYATNKGSGAPGSGTVSSFAVDRSTGALTWLNSASSEGVGPAYLSVHPSGRHVLVANYAGGSVAVLPIEANGTLGRATDVKRLEGAVGPSTARSAPAGSFAISGHDAPHAHMIQADPAGRFAIACDLGTDRILVWRFDEKSGTLSPGDPASVPLPPGDGPRHFVFHPNGRWFYSLQEEGSTIVLFDYDPAAGTLTHRRTVSSLPPGFAGTSFASGIAISAEGRFVYAANRLHDGISLFSVGADGTLTFVDDVWTRGDYPRDIAFDPTGSLLYSCNQRSDAVTAFRVDRRTGGLAFTGKCVPVGSPSVIVFLRLGAS